MGRRLGNYALIAALIVAIFAFCGVLVAAGGAIESYTSRGDRRPAPAETKPETDPADWIVLDERTRVLCDGSTAVYEAQGDGRHLTTVTNSVHCPGGPS